MNNKLKILFSSFLLISLSAHSQKDLNEIIKNFPSYDNFQNSFTTRAQRQPGSNEISQTEATINYYRLYSDSTFNYAYHFLIDTTLSIMFDGKNYLRILHNNKTYILGDRNHSNIQTYQGNIFAIKELLRAINVDETIEYTITKNDISQEIEVQFSVKTLLFLEIPIKIFPSNKINSTEITIILDTETYYPKIYRRVLNMNDGKSQLFEHIFEKPKMIKAQKITAIDSIPPGYQGERIVQKEKKKEFEGTLFPSYTMKTIEDKTISSEGISGKVILYDFFALWCAPCQFATDYLVKLKDSIHSENFEIICIDAMKNSEVEKLIKYKNQKKIDYPILIDGVPLQSKLEITSLPTFVLVDKSNKIVRYQEGFSVNLMEEFKNKIERLLKE